MLIATPATRLLGIRHPVLLAPMDLVADARLTAAVSAAGGLGILGGGDGDEEWLRRELDLLQHSGARFGVGFITWSLAKNPKLLDLALERKPTAVMLSSGDPAQFSEKVKRADSVLICQVQSLAFAKRRSGAGQISSLRRAQKVVVTGPHVAFFSLVPEMVDALDKKIPVVAAGGIADGRGLAAALTRGASGVLMGTRFYATQVSAGRDGAKAKIRAATGDDTLRSIVFDISRRNIWPAPFTGRCLRNAHLDRWYAGEQDSEFGMKLHGKAPPRRHDSNAVHPARRGAQRPGLNPGLQPARQQKRHAMPRAQAHERLLANRERR